MIAPEEKADRVAVAQAADELLNIKGVKASFAAGVNNQGMTVISGRSLGEINVQVILEALGLGEGSSRG